MLTDDFDDSKTLAELCEEQWLDEMDVMSTNPEECEDESYQFGVSCRQKGMNSVAFLAAVSDKYEGNPYLLDSAKAGFSSLLI